MSLRYALVDWTDPSEWASWQICGWQPENNLNGWSCLLPTGHQGPHIAHLSMENSPRGESYVSGPWVSRWEAPERCRECGHTHPGYRHATRNDPVVIVGNAHDIWGPTKNHQFPDGEKWLRHAFVPTFVDVYPTPPKFKTMEEAEAWLDAHPPT